MLSFVGLSIPLETIYPLETKYRIFSVNPLFEYKNGEKLDKQVGTRYLIGSPIDCEKFNVKVLGKKALCSNDDIANIKEPVFVHLVNPVAREYRLSDGKYGVTVTADDIVITND